MESSRHLQGLLIIAALIAVGGLFLWQNSQPAITVSVPAATATHDESQTGWQATLDAELQASTPLPTPELELTAFTPPTLPGGISSEDSIIIYEPTQIQSDPWPTQTPAPTREPDAADTPATPLPVEEDSVGPTPFPSPTGVLLADTGNTTNFQPPPEEVPLSPHADDHFWLVRPVDASANSASLFYYPFGSNGPRDEWRVHHGVDMPNPIGEPILAGGSGTIVWAGNGAQIVDQNNVEIYPSYGNVVIIEHDFGYRGQKIWTLYAHMSSVLVEEGQHVEAGQIIGLIGGTGDVSGPHVHMEVRVDKNSYFSTQNPLLWIAPYLGTGVIAGRVTYPDGTLADDAVITLSQGGRVVETTTTYIQPYQEDSTTWHVVPDRAWQENFVLGDVAEGTYTITVTIGERRISNTITVKAGTTNFIALGFEPAATPRPVDDDDEAVSTIAPG